MLCGWENNRRSGVALAMRHGLSGLSTHRLNGLRKGDEHPAYVPEKCNMLYLTLIKQSCHSYHNFTSALQASFMNAGLMSQFAERSTSWLDELTISSFQRRKIANIHQAGSPSSARLFIASFVVSTKRKTNALQILVLSEFQFLNGAVV